MTQPTSDLRGLLEADPEVASQVIASVRKRLIVPHAKQRPIAESDARFRVVRAGRRFGKTKISAREIVRHAISTPNSMNWWVSNQWKNTRRGYREVVKQLPPELLAKPAPSDTSPELILRLKNGSRIEFYSGESPESLAGEGVDFVVVDEAALIRDRVWYQLIRPTLMDSGGKALIISTPRGKNWFHTIWNRGADPEHPSYEAWHYSSHDNPYLLPEDIDEARATLPSLIYSQEIEAEFVSNAASIFTIPPEVVHPMTAEPHGQIYMGIDLAKKTDFTVLSASREGDRLPVYHDRFNTISWPEQREIILDAVRSLEAYPRVDGVTVLVDVGGPGDVIFDDLEEAGLDVVAINFTNWKEKAVKLLAADLERGDAHLLTDQVTEFESYEYTVTSAGRYKFEAATGHDDEVSAKLLEHWGHIHHGAPTMHMIDGQTIADVEPTEGYTELDVTPDQPSEIMARPEVWA